MNDEASDDSIHTETLGKEDINSGIQAQTVRETDQDDAAKMSGGGNITTEDDQRALMSPKKKVLIKQKSSGKAKSPQPQPALDEPKKVIRLLDQGSGNSRKKKTLQEKEKEAIRMSKTMNKRSKKRFGHTVSFDKYKTNNLIKIICIVIAVIIIPLEIFMQKLLTNVELPMIDAIQKSFGNSEWLLSFFEVPLTLVRPQATMFCMQFLYLTTDSLLAFKSAIITCLGYYILTVLKLLYKDGRPFWISQEVVGYRCRFDFAAPSYHLYTLTTFWAYNIIMYRMKYAEKVNKLQVNIMFMMLVIFGIWVVIGALHQGTTFLYQEFMGLLYGIMFLVLCMNFDSSIHRLCERTGFIVETSRKYKFYLFFLCLGLFFTLLLYYLQECEDFISPQFWLDNSIKPEHDCSNELYRHSQNVIGLDQTFRYTAIVFFVVGMGFGTSYSITKVDCIDWVHTRGWKRILRGLIGVGITFGVLNLIWLINSTDSGTIFMLDHALPGLLFSFFTYGWFPIICQKVGLVDVTEHDELLDEEGNMRGNFSN